MLVKKIIFLISVLFTCAVKNLYSGDFFSLFQSSINMRLLDASITGQVERVKQLIGSGADVNAQTEYGDTPLTGAVYEGHEEVVKVLIAAGADLNKKGRKGQTAREIAQNREHYKIIQLLDDARLSKYDDIDNGTDLMLKNFEDRENLKIALERKKYDIAITIIDKLIKNNKAMYSIVRYLEEQKKKIINLKKIYYKSDLD